MVQRRNSIKVVVLAFALLHTGFCAFGNSIPNVGDEECSNLSLVGGKAAALSSMKFALNINIPEGFCVTTEIYDEYLDQIGATALIGELERCGGDETKVNRLSWEIRSKILSGKLKESWLSEIDQRYDQLCSGGKGLLVAVRSSSTAEDTPNHSFAGQYESYLNINGVSYLIESIKKVWASAYNCKVINYRNRNGIKHSDTKMGVLVQKMVEAAASGRGYSVEIETGLPFVSIKSIYGLGEAEASGITSPDTWVLDADGNIIKRHLGTKQFRIEYDLEKCDNRVVENSEKLKKEYAIGFEQVRRLAGIIKSVHEYFLPSGIKHIEIEYAITDAGKIFVTQARPETSWGKLGTNSFQAVDKGKLKGDNKLILSGGKMGWGGVVVGTLRVLKSLKDAEKRHKKGDVIVVGNTANVWENVMVNSGGLISQEDSSSSHAVATTREECIPSVVGVSDAVATLGKYDGQVVTLDATSRRVYLGVVPKEAFYFPKEIETVFEGFDAATEERHWENACCVGLTSVDSDGNGWLKRPVCGFRLFQYKINEAAFDWVATKLNLPPISRIRINNGILEMSFSEAHRWREILRERDQEFFEKIYNERVRINDRHIKASLSLDYTSESVRQWLDSAVEFYGIQHISYSFGKITDGLLHNALAKRRLREPYLSLVRPSMEAFYGKSLSKERVCLRNELLDRLKSNLQLSLAIRNVAENIQGAELILKNNFSKLYKDIEIYAKNYRVTESFSIDFAQPWFLKVVAKQLVNELDCDKKEDVSSKISPIKDDFFPDDEEFQRIARLAILAQKLKLDTHHIRCRGHWKFKEFVAPFGEFLKNKGVISSLSEIFDCEPQWLLNQLDKYRDDDGFKLLSEKRTVGFKVLPYQAYTIGNVSFDHWGNGLGDNFPRGGKKVCSFCNSDLESVLYKKNGFYVQLNDNPASEGALLINPTNHMFSFAVLGKERIEVLDDLHVQVREILQEVYAPEDKEVIFFEHGSTSFDEAKACISGSSIVHAHLHAIPVPKGFDFMATLRMVLKENFSDNNFKILEIKRMLELTDRNVVPDDVPYLFVENADGRMWVVIIEDDRVLPSMFLLRIIAEKVGTLGKGNWKILSDVMRKTCYEQLKGAKGKLVPAFDKMFGDGEASKRHRGIIVMDDIRKDLVDILYLSTTFRLLKIEYLVSKFISNLRISVEKIENGVERLDKMLLEKKTKECGFKKGIILDGELVRDNYWGLNLRFVEKTDYVRTLFVKMADLFKQARSANIEKNEQLLLEKLVDLLEVARTILGVFDKCRDGLLNDYVENNSSYLLDPIFG